MSGWRPVHVGFEGDGLRIGGVAVWAQRWQEAEGGPVTLPHPAYPEQRHAYWLYDAGEPPVRFAAGELSNGVWGFWVPEG